MLEGQGPLTSELQAPLFSEAISEEKHMLRAALFSERSLLTGGKKNSLVSTRKCSIHSVKSKSCKNCEEVSTLCNIRGLRTRFIKCHFWCRDFDDAKYLMITFLVISKCFEFDSENVGRFLHTYTKHTAFIVACGDSIHMLSSLLWVFMLWLQSWWYVLAQNSSHSQNKRGGGGESHLLHTCH